MKNLIYLFFFLFAVHGFSQTAQEKLEIRREQLVKEIATFKNMLSDEKKKEQSVLVKIAQNKARIDLSQRLINTTNKQMRILNDDIYLKQLEINKLNRELEILKEDYAKMIVKSYKSRNDQSRVMFVLSSDNFLQAYKRIQYMKQYASFRKMQGVEIEAKQVKLGEIKKNQEASIKMKAKSLIDFEAEKIAIVEQKKEQEVLAKEYNKNKKKYIAEINAKDGERKSIDRQIKQLIAAAIAEANKKNAAKTGVKSSGSSSTFELTPEGKIVSSNFKANKGKLSWPVTKGYVYLKYGDQRHPVHTSLTIHNSGVEIATEPGSNAIAIFDGEVLQIQVIKGSNKKVVLIQHGEFLTIYQNLETVNVKEGDKITRKQVLGRIQTDPNGKAILKFMVSQNATTLNPEDWLSNM